MDKTETAEDVTKLNLWIYFYKYEEDQLTQSEPIWCRVKHLGHGDAEEVVQVAAPGAPARVLVTPEAVEKHVPGDENGHQCLATHTCY